MSITFPLAVGVLVADAWVDVVDELEDVVDDVGEVESSPPQLAAIKMNAAASSAPHRLMAGSISRSVGLPVAP